MLKLKKDRKFTYEHEDKENDISFSVTFEHPFAEDEDMTVLKDALKDIPENVTPEEKTSLVEEVSLASGNKMYMNRLRIALVSWTDIEDEEHPGEPLPFNELNQKLVFECVQSIPDLFKQITNDKYGSQLTVKNLKAGVTQQ